MLSFESDYILGAHEAVLDALVKTNNEMLPGYGNDVHTENAKRLIRDACSSPESDVFFLMGGTQANKTIIATMLKPFEGVIAPTTGHVSLHEVGAIEYTGHKVIEIAQTNGKIDIDALEQLLTAFYGDANNQHMPEPKMVYLSHPTEYGTLYSLEELTRISDFCHMHGMMLYLDGARLGYGLASLKTDVTLQDITRLCDAYYIGGTKVGALCGEAVVFNKNALPRAFFSKIKQHGALLAKGRLLGIQFDTLFTDDLYFKLGRHAIEMAEKLKNIFIS